MKDHHSIQENRKEQQDFHKRQHTSRIFCHLSALGMFLVPPFFFPLIGNIVGPLVIWLMKRNSMPLVDQEGKESLNFQISMTIYAAIGSLLFVRGIGYWLLILVTFFDIGCVLWACIKTSHDEHVRYPFSIRFIR